MNAVSGRELRQFRGENHLTVARAAHLANTTERLIMDHENDDPPMLLSVFNRMKDKLNQEPSPPTSNTSKGVTKRPRGCCG